MTSDGSEQSPPHVDGFVPSGLARQRPNGARRTPRKSLIVVLPDDYVVSTNTVTERMPIASEGEEVDLIVACAGQPHSIAALQRTVRDLQLLLAPAGTSNEDLRELAIERARGDIITLLSGTPVQSKDRST
jgi:hypothetical protein